MNIPSLNDQLSLEQISFLNAFSKSCRRSILQMVTNAQSGHPGGSLSSIDYLTLIYAFIISQTGNPIVVSNGHISPAVYGVLAEMGYIPKDEVIETFRKIHSIYEGHVCRHVPGIWYGTGPLGVGVSVASAFAHAEKLRSTNQKVFGLFGDGEAQEGQVHEMVHYAKKYKLDNLILFVDYNDVQLSASLDEIMPIDINSMFRAGGFEVIEVDGHNFADMWQALAKAYQVVGKPVLISAKTIMGKGIEFMEPDGIAKKASWHGKSPSHEATNEALTKIEMKESEIALIDSLKPLIKWVPERPVFTEGNSLIKEVQTGEPKTYETGTVTESAPHHHSWA